jgi:hypothetical protein
MSVFGPDGTLVTTSVMPDATAGPGTFVLDAQALDSDHLLLYGNFFDPTEGGRPAAPARRITRDGYVTVIGNDGRMRAPLVRFSAGFNIAGERYKARSPFSDRPFVTANHDRIIFGSGRTYELVVRDFDLRPLEVIRWSGWEQRLTESVLETTRERLQASLERAPFLDAPAQVGEANKRMMEDFFNPELLPDTLPVLGAVLLDEGGRIWVARFQLHEDFLGAMSASDVLWDQEDVWHVLDADGTPIARVRLPAETRLLAVRRDRVIVVTRDELDVESVRVLSISKGAVER